MYRRILYDNFEIWKLQGSVSYRNGSYIKINAQISKIELVDTTFM